MPVELADRTERLNLDIDELSAVGRSLYALLGKFTGYRIAAVGWERADTWFDLDELRSDYADELAAGDLPGLVVSDDVYETLPGAKGFKTFEPGYQWIPYRGEKST
ncbi:hypothetical protein B1H26_18445 [Amycolatopsis sp. BJA-103]|nr:hypothetical protein BKN51_16065 [Amycolatopsis sp. BJA-103]PNE16967.1 hypothetical protein B1H26_18445 [Amycolatopsis sp. BJA-103]